VRSLVDQTVVRFGRLDAAVNTDGTEGKPGPMTEHTAESYSATFDTNVLGTLLSMKHELRVMQAQHSGSIINISSTYGHLGARGASVYAASKHAVEGMTRSAALEAAVFSVRVNAVAPGPTETAMLNRFTGTPEEGSTGIERAARARRRTGGDRRRDRLPRLQQGGLRDRPHSRG
jgi:NAD(P)-dependent dehydrogenase (short-subunit alcohol dehydrogenase family)